MEFFSCADFLYDLFLSGDANLVLYVGKEKNVIIPPFLDGHTVTTIGGFAFSGMDFIESVVIPDSIDEIKAGAFERCTSLKNIVIPASVTDIEESAFAGCSVLKLTVTPNSAAHIYADEYGIKYLFADSM